MQFDTKYHDISITESVDHFVNIDIFVMLTWPIHEHERLFLLMFSLISFLFLVDYSMTTSLLIYSYFAESKVRRKSF